MKKLLSKIWFPFTVVILTSASALALGPKVEMNEHLLGARVETIAEKPDTVIYTTPGYKSRWTAEDYRMGKESITDSLFINGTDSVFVDSLKEAASNLPSLSARDTIVVPDSLRYTDPFRYKYYVALRDSLTHIQVRDSLKAAGDTLDWPRLDSLYKADSILAARIAFEKWYNGLSKEERKLYDKKQKVQQKLRESNAAQALKEKEKERKDSILKETPRILETFAFPDSLQYQRMVRWTHDREFHKLGFISLEDTTANYRFYDFPFKRNDVNATWLGVSGSPVQYYNYFNRKSSDKVSFYEAQESWSWTPATVPNYNTKTPYTELGYSGTLFAGTEKESDNLHLLTTQNITPELNFRLLFDRYGGGGILPNENTINKNTVVNVNYVGKRYMLHTGHIYNYVTRQENGGIQDNSWIRDTTVNAREIAVNLNDASSRIKKNTLYLDQQYRIPFTFINDLRDKKEDRWYEQHYKDSIARKGDSLNVESMNLYLDAVRQRRAALDTSGNRDLTTAFIGHSSEFSTYRRIYNDKGAGKFYNGVNYINPNRSDDSLRVSRLENKVFIRLQPWSEDAIISKLNLGAGSRIRNYYVPDPSFTKTRNNVIWNSEYLYAGAEGNLRGFFDWDAKAEYVFLGKEWGDFSVDANMGFKFYPFRKARKSPVSIDLHFDTELDEPEYYQQHMLTNHYRWDNEFSKISTTRLQGELSVPRWKLDASVGYALLANNIYYDTLGIIRQNPNPMSVLTANINKEFVLGPLHLDNRVLFQLSSNQEVLPLPSVALNLKYYIEMNLGKGAMRMQAGINGFFNTAWYSPAWNPALGVFHNQNEHKYNNGPYFDAFINMQWKRACIFVKYENAGQGWPMKSFDYFSAHHYINTQRGLKLGIYWPFYRQPGKTSGSASSSASPGQR